MKSKIFNPLHLMASNNLKASNDEGDSPAILSTAEEGMDTKDNGSGNGSDCGKEDDDASKGKESNGVTSVSNGES